MCDYSLQNVQSRPAKVGDRLNTWHFNTGTLGFAAPEDATTAVCVLPGTELAFAREVKCEAGWGLLNSREKTINYTTAVFRQINKDKPLTHHDALEFPERADRPADGFVGGPGSNGPPASGSTSHPGRGGRHWLCPPTPHHPRGMIQVGFADGPSDSAPPMMRPPAFAA
jgi:hypothetical protein